MLVSAVSANHVQVVRPINYGFINSRGGDNGVETTVVDSFITAQKKNNVEPSNVGECSSANCDNCCSKQVVGRKLNVIA